MSLGSQEQQTQDEIIYQAENETSAPSLRLTSRTQ